MEIKPPEHPPTEQDALSVNANDDSYAFVIRIWREDESEDDDAGETVLWRGHITNVIDQKRRHFQDLTGIIQFIRPYLEQWGTFRNQKSEIQNHKS